MAAPAIDTTTATASQEINQFFSALFGQLPVVSEDRKGTTYSIPGHEFSVVTDSYGGCHINCGSKIFDSLKEAIGQLSASYKANRTFDSLWVDMPLPVSLSTLGAILPSDFEAGNSGKSGLIYDYQKNMLKSWLWLNPGKECSIPAGATHNIGGTALIIDKAAGKVLLVENTRRAGSWNLPGGSFEPGKDKLPSDTALREAEEESGLSIDRKSLAKPVLISQMQFPENQFAPAINQTWAFFIDGISQHELRLPAEEIKRAEWVDILKITESTDEGINGAKIGSEIKASVTAAVHSLGCQEIENKGWMIVHAPKLKV